MSQLSTTHFCTLYSPLLGDHAASLIFHALQAAGLGGRNLIGIRVVGAGSRSPYARLGLLQRRSNASHCLRGTPASALAKAPARANTFLEDIGGTFFWRPKTSFWRPNTFFWRPNFAHRPEYFFLAPKILLSGALIFRNAFYAGWLKLPVSLFAISNLSVASSTPPPPGHGRPAPLRGASLPSPSGGSVELEHKILARDDLLANLDRRLISAGLYSAALRAAPRHRAGRWGSVEVGGGRWGSVEVGGGRWGSVEVGGRSVEVGGGRWRSVEVGGGRWR